VGAAGAVDPGAPAAVSASGQATDAGPGRAGRHLVRGPDRDRLERAADVAVRRFGRDLLAAAGRVARSRGLAATARDAADRAARRRSPGPGGRAGGRLPRACAQRGDHVGPSPVDRAKPGSKHHLITDANGIPLAVILTGGNRNDVTQLIPLIEAIPPIRGIRGRPLRRPKRIYGDRGYDHDKYRRLVRDLGITPVIARRSTGHGSGLGKVRWPVERTFAWLHHWHRLRIRTERRADTHQALLSLACSMICLRQLILN
jgi:transposase